MSQDESSFDFSDLCDVPPYDQFPQDDLPVVPPNSPISQSITLPIIRGVDPIHIRDDEWSAFKDACTAVNIGGKTYIRYTPPGVDPLNLISDRKAERKQFVDKMKASGRWDE
jgi:hypothetical protein